MPIGIEQFINLNDQQLYQMAEYQTALSADRSRLKNNSVMYGIPLLDSFTRASMDGGTMASKAVTFTNRMLGWAGFFGLASIYNNAVDSLKETFPAVKQFDNEHPLVSTVFNVMGLWVALDYAYKGIRYAGQHLSQKYPEKLEMLKSFKQNMLGKIDNSWVDSKVYKPVSSGIRYMENHFPEITKGLKAVVPWTAPVIVAGAFTKSLCTISKMKNTTNENFERLKQMQEQVREQICG